MQVFEKIIFMLALLTLGIAGVWGFQHHDRISPTAARTRYAHQVCDEMLSLVAEDHSAHTFCRRSMQAYVQYIQVTVSTHEGVASVTPSAIEETVLLGKVMSLGREIMELTLLEQADAAARGQ